MRQSLLEWRRGSRSSFALTTDIGVYALFLRNGAVLPGIVAGVNGLIYIGLAANRNGLKGRCHFDARTRNHSPRKSLAVLLREQLSLTPALITKPNASDTWGLDAQSDARLSAWMHANLELAIEVCSDPDGRETELVSRYAPPLNLTKCIQTDQHRRISQARAAVMAELQGRPGRIGADSPAPGTRHAKPASVSKSSTAGVTRGLSSAARKIVGAEIDTAEAIAARYDLNAKSYRQRLRISIPWYCKPQDWTFPVDSVEWRDMIAVAEKMSA